MARKLPPGVLLVHLARMWPPDAPKDEQKDLWEEIKAGRKTSEFRDATDHWRGFLFKEMKVPGHDLTYDNPKVTRIWMVVGFPKGSLPRLEADIKRIVTHCDDDGYAEQFEIEFENVVECR